MAVGLFLTCWLLPGQRKIPHNIVLDVHTMIFGVIFTLMGAQILAIGAFAKVFSYSERFDRNTVSLKRVLKRVTFESGLLLGGLLFLCGFAGCAYVADGHTSAANRTRTVTNRFIGFGLLSSSFHYLDHVRA